MNYTVGLKVTSSWLSCVQVKNHTVILHLPTPRRLGKKVSDLKVLFNTRHLPARIEACLSHCFFDGIAITHRICAHGPVVLQSPSHFY